MDLVERYLPLEFFDRLPAEEGAWRGRIILLLWSLGYPLGMAWSFGLTDDEDMTAFYQEAVAALEDERLIAQLETTVASRGDGSEFSFWRLG